MPPSLALSARVQAPSVRACVAHLSTSVPTRRRAHSGLQKQILLLYKQCLSRALSFPSSDGSRAEAVAYVRGEFRAKARSVDKMDFQRIEYLIRHAKKKLEGFSAEGVRGFASTGGGGAQGVEGRIGGALGEAKQQGQQLR